MSNSEPTTKEIKDALVRAGFHRGELAVRGQGRDRPPYGRLTWDVSRLPRYVPLATVDHDPGAAHDRYGRKPSWMVKIESSPAGTGRGEGIHGFDDLDEAAEYIFSSWG